VAQQRAIYAISKALGLQPSDVLAEFFVVDPRDLSVRDASALIDQLHQKQEALRPQ
jgi:hypothetical protein